MARSVVVILLSLVAIRLVNAEDEFPSYYTPEQKARMKKSLAEVEASMAKITDKERVKVNQGLKMMHEICTAKEKKLLYEVDHEAIAKEARMFGESLNGRTLCAKQEGSSDQEWVHFATLADLVLPPNRR